ncbi:histone-lysine N-methyltransferase ATX4-like [Dorcoceras hygrometricum]|uniref:Histone-lysine N-methyltransferase ATX4-like n=1 Tax=Dorcoceras hygrometricum TaxID=472368 RepID=A0A2Z7CZ21_9LAMI|nr:histone-lysine N-methyltransferase ATX4-like [Dorcoceras hygrometricum]
MHTNDHQTESQAGPIPEIPAGGDKESTAGGPEVTMEMTPEVEKQADDTSNAAEQEEHIDYFVLDDFGGAELPLFSSFDRYPLETLNRRWRRSAKLMCIRAMKCVVPEKSNAIIEVVTAGFECLPPSCDGLTGPDDHGRMISTGRLAVRGSSGNQVGPSGVPAGRCPFT